MTPAEAQQVIAHRFGQVSFVRVFVQTDRAVAFGQLGAVFAQNHGDVRKLRHVPAHGVVNHALAEGIRQVVIAADHVGDAHVVVVDNDGQHVCGRAITAQQNHIVQLRIGYAHVALHRIADQHFIVRAVGRLDAYHGFYASGGVFGVAVAPAAVIARRQALGQLLFAHFVQLFRRAIAVIGFALGHQLVRDFGVAVHARELKNRLAIPLQPQPAHAVEDRLYRGLGRSCAVGVFDTQQELPAHMFGEQPVEQRRAAAANVQVAGGGRGEAGDDFGHDISDQEPVFCAEFNVSFPSMARFLTAFGDALQNQRERWIFWLPVPMAYGIAVYFGLHVEPPLLLGTLVLGLMLPLLHLFYRNQAVFIPVLAIFFSLAGFTAVPF